MRGVKSPHPFPGYFTVSGRVPQIKTFVAVDGTEGSLWILNIILLCPYWRCVAVRLFRRNMCALQLPSRTHVLCRKRWSEEPRRSTNCSPRWGGDTAVYIADHYLRSRWPDQWWAESLGTATFRPSANYIFHNTYLTCHKRYFDIVFCVGTGYLISPTRMLRKHFSFYYSN